MQLTARRDVAGKKDGLADQYVYYSPYQFAGNEVTIAIDLDGDEPKYMIDGNSQLTRPMKALLNSAFGYSLETLNKTTWKPRNFKHGAITLFRSVIYNKNFSSSSAGFWGNLIAHEQKHRDDVGNDMVGAFNYYVNYLVGFVIGGLKEKQNPLEVSAYEMGRLEFGASSEMNRLLNFDNGAALKVLQGNFSETEQIETLTFLGNAFVLSEQTNKLNGLKERSQRLSSNGKSTRRIEKKIAKQEKRVNEAYEKTQEAITENVQKVISSL